MNRRLVYSALAQLFVHPVKRKDVPSLGSNATVTGHLSQGNRLEYGFTSLLPPLIAILLAMLTRRVLLPLACGILVGAVLLTWGQTETASVRSIAMIFATSIWQSVTDADHVQVLAFTLLLGMMVGVIEAAGSLRRVIVRFAAGVGDRRGVQTMIAATGLAVFFDDYANTLLVGGTMRSTADRFGISRAKLAYLVDSTAAPVAGLALVSTWVATELSYLQAGIDASHYGQSTDGGQSVRVFDFFLQSIPYRFYPWFALALVFIVARTGRDFGLMRRAEEEAIERMAGSVNGLSNGLSDGGSEEPGDVPGRVSASTDLFAALLPIATCLIAVMITLVVTGNNALAEATEGAAESAVQSQSPSSVSLSVPLSAELTSGWLDRVRVAGNVIGSGDSYRSLVIGGACGLGVAMLLAIFVSRLVPARLFGGIADGAIQMMPAMAVLWLAWALSAMTGSESLDTGGYLASVLSDRIDLRFLPTCVFLLAGGIAFATGTSWGTMAIVTPIAVSLVLDMQAASSAAAAVSSQVAVNSPVALATFSSVLAGAIFGDHCSPLSDTTVLSSRACGCDHVLHVQTQMPYAILAAAVCIACGTLPVAFGVPVWVCICVGMVTLLVVTRWLGRPTGRSFAVELNS